MAHESQRQYCLRVKKRFPKWFHKKKILDAGSLDINGSNRYLFTDCEYTGIDVGEGKNVDIVSTIHEFDAKDESYDVIISTECFEHDMYYEKSLKNIVRMLKPHGLFLFTCATTGRFEHGTRRSAPGDAPLLNEKDIWQDYYKNLTEKDVRDSISIESNFLKYQFEIDTEHKDLQFWGIKKWKIKS